MRTTVTLDPDADDIVRRLMREGGLSFKEAVNAAIRAGAPGRRRRRHRTPTFDLGAQGTPLDKALRLASELEDAELVRKLAARR